MENKRENKYDSVIVFETKDYEWGVKDENGNEIVPVGKYAWIDGFDHGLARVHTKGSIPYTGNTNIEFDIETGKVIDRETLFALDEKRRKAHPEQYAKWGIINEKGEEVLPLEYDSIWKYHVG